MLQMKTSGEIKSELLEIAPGLATIISPGIPYAVPAKYFDGFLTALMQRINQDEKAVLGGSAFNHESAEAELAVISPMLSALKTKTTYQVPAGYFESIRIPLPERET